MEWSRLVLVNSWPLMMAWVFALFMYALPTIALVYFIRHVMGIKRLAAIAVAEGCTRYVWQVLDWNTPSIDFYRAMGAQFMTDWLTCRVEGDALARLAADEP